MSSFYALILRCSANRPFAKETITVKCQVTKQAPVVVVDQ